MQQTAAIDENGVVVDCAGGETAEQNMPGYDKDVHTLVVVPMLLHPGDVVRLAADGSYASHTGRKLTQQEIEAAAAIAEAESIIDEARAKLDADEILTPAQLRAVLRKIIDR